MVLFGSFGGLARKLLVYVLELGGVSVTWFNEVRSSPAKLDPKVLMVQSYGTYGSNYYLQLEVT